MSMELRDLKIFLALAALFEGFRDPVIILIYIPMSLAGAVAGSFRSHPIALSIFRS